MRLEDATNVYISTPVASIRTGDFIKMISGSWGCVVRRRRGAYESFVFACAVGTQRHGEFFLNLAIVEHREHSIARVCVRRPKALEIPDDEADKLDLPF